MAPLSSPDQDDTAFDYVETTNGITIRAQPEFMDDESEPDEHRFFWAYTIRIENEREEDIELLTRRWRIIDAGGRAQQVDGEGVVGEQPVIGPGETFEYTSCAPLQTPSGLMEGSYEFNLGEGRERIPVPRFSLDSPYITQLIN